MLAQTYEPERALELYTVIVTYNSTPWLDQCFGALRAHGLLANTIVVDNGSTDATVARLQERYPEVQLVQSGRNLGFGAGNNLGIRRALTSGAEFVFLLNHDAWPVNDAIDLALAHLRAHPTCGLVSPVHVQADEHTLDPLFARYLTQSGRQLTSAGELPFEVAFVNAAAWLIPRRTLEQVGLFSPLFFHYGEDRDYIARLQHHGLRVDVLPQWRIVHDRGNRPNGWEVDASRQARAMKVGLLQRLSDPRYNATQRRVHGLAWLGGNVVTALRSGAWSVLPALKDSLAQALRSRTQRHEHLHRVRKPTGAFLHESTSQWA